MKHRLLRALSALAFNVSVAPAGDDLGGWTVAGRIRIREQDEAFPVTDLTDPASTRTFFRLDDAIRNVLDRLLDLALEAGEPRARFIPAAKPFVELVQAGRDWQDALADASPESVPPVVRRLSDALAAVFQDPRFDESAWAKVDLDEHRVRDEERRCCAAELRRRAVPSYTGDDEGIRLVEREVGRALETAAEFLETATPLPPVVVLRADRLTPLALETIRVFVEAEQREPAGRTLVVGCESEIETASKLADDLEDAREALREAKAAQVADVAAAIKQIAFDLDGANDALAEARRALVESGGDDLPFLCDGIRRFAVQNQTPIRQTARAIEASVERFFHEDPNSETPAKAIALLVQIRQDLRDGLRGATFRPDAEQALARLREAVAAAPASADPLRISAPVLDVLAVLDCLETLAEVSATGGEVLSALGVLISERPLLRALDENVVRLGAALAYGVRRRLALLPKGSDHGVVLRFGPELDGIEVNIRRIEGNSSADALVRVRGKLDALREEASKALRAETLDEARSILAAAAISTFEATHPPGRIAFVKLDEDARDALDVLRKAGRRNVPTVEVDTTRLALVCENLAEAAGLQEVET